MVRRSSFGIVILLIVALLTPPVMADGVSYLYSDLGDIPLYEALSSKMDVVPSKKPSGDVILALDLNYGFMNERSREILPALLREAKAGKTVIIGLNTLRSLKMETPETLKLLGISVNFTKSGILEIEPKNGFEFEPFRYDSNVYGIARVEAPNKRVLLESSGIPVVIEIPIGKGKLVVLTINPSDYYLKTENPAVVEFLVAVVKHCSSKGFPVKTSVAIGLLGATGAIYLATSNNPTCKKIREWIKLLPLAIGRFITPPKDVLKNSTRKAIYSYIKARGYATISEVASTFSISRTNARWHLSVLKRARLLDETTIGNTTIFHLPGEENRKKAVRDFLLENKTRREIYNLLIQGKSLSEIARILKISKSTVHYNIRILKEYGVVGEKDE